MERREVICYIGENCQRDNRTTWDQILLIMSHFLAKRPRDVGSGVILSSIMNLYR